MRLPILLGAAIAAALASPSLARESDAFLPKRIDVLQDAVARHLEDERAARRRRLTTDIDAMQDAMVKALRDMARD